MSSSEILLIGVIILVLLMIVSNRIRADLVGILIIICLPILGLITFEDALSGFSRPVVITIIGLFVITQALEDVGIVQWLADRLKTIGKGSESRLVFLFMAAGATLSLIMNNIAAGAVLLPAAVQVARESNVAPSKILIPLSFGTLVGGMATYFTTANIILSGILQEQGQTPLTMLSFLPTGGLIALLSILFMSFLGKRLLPKRVSAAQHASAYALSQSLADTYALEERLWEVKVLSTSTMVNKTIGETGIIQELGLSVLAIWRGQRTILNPDDQEMICARIIFWS